MILLSNGSLLTLQKICKRYFINIFNHYSVSSTHFNRFSRPV